MRIRDIILRFMYLQKSLFQYLLTSVFAAITMTGCSLDGLVKVDEPEEGRSVQIGEVTTRSGALAVYAGAIGNLQVGVKEISRSVSLFTDERALRSGVSSSSTLDARIETRNSGSSLVGLVVSEPYIHLNSARITFLQLRDIIRTLNDSSLDYLLSASYALEAYSVLMLAENYCSGFPLSTLTFNGTVRYESGSSTSNALKIAVSLFDSSQRIAHDSTRFISLAKIGKGRAYLSLGMLDSAIESVADVNISDVFHLHYSEAQVISAHDGAISRPYAFWSYGADLGTPAEEIKNGEGMNGLYWYPFTGGTDTRVTVITQQINGVSVPRQRKYFSGAVQLPLARGIEKKLIEAEYLLSKGDANWINAINDARRSIGIQDTVDQNTERNQVDLLFRERALWFYLDGHRLADYRRLVRQYNRSPYEVYPVGVYEGGIGHHQIYGDAFVFSPPESPNRKYQGCDHRQP